MQGHEFAVGQSVTGHARMGAWQPAGAFEIVRTLPSDGRECQYRLKSAADGHERVTAESELTAAAA